MKKRLRKKMWKIGRIEYGELFMDLEIHFTDKDEIYLPLGHYYTDEWKIYKFKV